jgi:hypothetical protein
MSKQHLQLLRLDFASAESVRAFVASEDFNHLSMIARDITDPSTEAPVAEHVGEAARQLANDLFTLSQAAARGEGIPRRRIKLEDLQHLAKGVEILCLAATHRDIDSLSLHALVRLSIRAVEELAAAKLAKRAKPTATGAA